MTEIEDLIKMVERELPLHLPKEKEASVLYDSMNYSVMAGGKRLRPVLLIESCLLAGGCIQDAMPFAIALEYIHTSSLIHDDLPAMDNDDMRRGKKTNHLVFGAGMATLAGDALLNTAYDLMANTVMKHISSGDARPKWAEAMSTIAEAAGASGMMAGQALDIDETETHITPELLDYIDEKKTASLITGAVDSGVIIGDGEKNIAESMHIYAEKIGRAFQIADDILDVTETSDVTGKPMGSDEAEGKVTYVSMHGLDLASAKLKELTGEAVEQVKNYDESGFFTSLALNLEKRKR